MKHLSLQFAAVAGLIGALGLLAAVPGQGKAAAARAAQPYGPTRIAVVDLSYLFQNYEKLEDLRQNIKTAAEDAQVKAKGYIERARSIEEQLKSGDFENGSSEFIERENEVIKLASRFEMFKATTTKDLKKKDAQILKAVYDDVRQAVALFAEQNGYSLVLQTNREITASEDKAKVAQKLGQPVFHNHRADDITDGVLAYLSQEYAANGAQKLQQPPAAKVPAAATRNASPATRNKTIRK